ncbi:heparan sulfate 2-O-sulfotransferase [Arctopsyche grandis]|uniref:heparan sulfate 2-O-sulfotransferase n=1 Tax=Arctopsyche grandis TaxID=121162 RepID=UPI00406D8C28
MAVADERNRDRRMRRLGEEETTRMRRTGKRSKRDLAAERRSPSGGGTGRPAVGIEIEIEMPLSPVGSPCGLARGCCSRWSWLCALLLLLSLLTLLFQAQLAHQQRQLDKIEKIQARRDLRDSSYQETNQHPVTNVESDDLVVIYNRVPKTGSTSFVGVAYDLCKKNAFKVLHVNITANMHVMALNNQYRFAQNITNWNSVKPALYHGHMAFLNFDRLGISSKPLYINLIRKPLDRLVSYYYFLRHGDNFRPHLVRKKHGNKMTFDECVEKNRSDCDPNNMWLQIPFFCGHAADCWKPGNEWALEQAKKNLLNNYLVVGVTEEMLDFISILEITLPRMFRGATQHFLSSNKSHLRQTTSKIPPSEKTVHKIQKSVIWKMENELYEFALEQFNFIKKRTLLTKDPNSIVQTVMYEKIRPK